MNYDLSKTGLTPLTIYGSGSFNDLPLGTVFAVSGVTDAPNSINSFTTTTFYFKNWGGNKAQIAIADSTNLMYFRVYSESSSWNSWTLLSDDSKVVHLSGANNFDTIPTVDNNPLLLASSLPSDLARTGQAQTFTAAQTFSIAPTITDASKDKGDNQAATMADLKSVEKAAWLDFGDKVSFITSERNSDESVHLAGSTCIYKLKPDEGKIYLMGKALVRGADDNSGIQSCTLNFDFSDVASNISVQNQGVSMSGGDNEADGSVVNNTTLSFQLAYKFDMLVTFSGYNPYVNYTPKS